MAAKKRKKSKKKSGKSTITVFFLIGLLVLGGYFMLTGNDPLGLFEGIEDMEARLDDLSFELAMAERRGDEPNQAMIIQRNNLDRRIQRLKEDESSDPPNNP